MIGLTVPLTSHHRTESVVSGLKFMGDLIYSMNLNQNFGLRLFFEVRPYNEMMKLSGDQFFFLK